MIDPSDIDFAPDCDGIDDELYRRRVWPIVMEALMPFVHMGNIYFGRKEVPDNQVIASFNGEWDGQSYCGRGRHTLTVGDVRRAAKAFAGRKYESKIS